MPGSRASLHIGEMHTTEPRALKSGVFVLPAVEDNKRAACAVPSKHLFNHVSFNQDTGEFAYACSCAEFGRKGNESQYACVHVFTVKRMLDCSMGTLCSMFPRVARAVLRSNEDQFIIPIEEPHLFRRRAIQRFSLLHPSSKGISLQETLQGNDKPTFVAVVWNGKKLSVSCSSNLCRTYFNTSIGDCSRDSSSILTTFAEKIKDERLCYHLEGFKNGQKLSEDLLRDLQHLYTTVPPTDDTEDDCFDPVTGLWVFKSKTREVMQAAEVPQPGENSIGALALHQGVHYMTKIVDERASLFWNMLSVREEIICQVRNFDFIFIFLVLVTSDPFFFFLPSVNKKCNFEGHNPRCH